MIATLAVMAPGLLGASVAMAARERGVARRVQVWARRAETRVELGACGWCDLATASVEEAAAGADLVVICTPVERIAVVASDIAGVLKPGALVTDVGSVKGEVCRAAAHALGGAGRFIGAHPMAGSEKSGHAHASAGLFEGRPCFVTPLPGDGDAEVEQVVRFWTELGARVVTMGPDAHDEIVAHVSHLPHLLAAVLAEFLSARPAAWAHYGGNGLRDTTRIAGGDAALWQGILEANREEVLRSLRGLQGRLDEVHAALANRDGFALRAVLERGREWRGRLV